MKSIVLLVNILILPYLANCQAIQSNIIALEVEHFSNGIYTFSNPINCTADNSENYNNQPYFYNDELFVTSLREGNQTDIYKYNFKNKERTRMTYTRSSEYSSELLPNGNYFSTVRVSAENSENQQLCLYDLKGKKKPIILLPELTNFGYYQWVNDSFLVAFMVGEPNQLELININSQERTLLRKRPGRTFLIDFDGTLYFVDKSKDEAWQLKKLNLTTSIFTPIAFMPDGCEDFCRTENDDLIVGQGSKLYKLNPNKDSGWEQIADFGRYGIKNITRIAWSKGRIAIVDDRAVIPKVSGSDDD